jgi:ATP-dependent Clp protease ATP-binding subunit ClpX
MDKQNRCSFCGKSRKEAEMLIAGISGNICEECTERASDIVKQQLKTQKSEKLNEIKPRRSMPFWTNT